MFRREGCEPLIPRPAYAAALAGAVLLAGCVGDFRDQAAREAAKAAIRPVLAQRLPGVPVEPAVNCVIDNASADELLTLAREGAISGAVTPRTERIVVGILRRPETITCLAEDGLPALLGVI